MYCKHCGHKIEDTDIYCSNCGTSTDYINSPKTRLNKNTNIYAIVGFIFSFVLGIVGLILSIIGYQRADTKYNGNCKKLAMTGLIISEITITWQITFISLIVSLIIIASL